MLPLSPKPRLLLITERFAPDLGGVARSAARTAEALAKLGVETHVLAWTRMLPAGELETRAVQGQGPEAAGLVVHRLGLFANLDYSLQHTLTFLDELHRQQPFDGVWGHYLFPAGFLAVLFAGTVGVPATVSARGNDVDMLMFPPGDFARLQWTLQRARAITAVSQDLARKIRLLLGDQRPVHVVPNSVDPELYQPSPPDRGLRSSLGILPGESVLGFSGELRHKKGLPYLLTCLVEVRQARPACLLVIGEVRVREQAALATFAAENPEAHARIVVTGHLEDPRQVARHLRLCDVYLQPSVWEGLPNALLEAMACERLVIASDAGGIPEVVEHGQSGFVIPRAQLNRLGEAVLEALGLSPDERQALGRAARRRILDRFSAAHEAAELGRVLNVLWPLSQYQSEA